MITIKMDGRFSWAVNPNGAKIYFFKSCEAAMTALLSSGVQRNQIEIDYELERKHARGLELAKRFAAKYGQTGRRFMPNGVLIGEEYPPPTGEVERRLKRKRQLVCPHCGVAVRAWIQNYREE